MKYLSVVLAILFFTPSCVKDVACEGATVLQVVKYVGYDDMQTHYETQYMNECDCIDSCFLKVSAWKQMVASIDTTTQAGKDKKDFYNKFRYNCDCK